jgi:hypothetical protein
MLEFSSQEMNSNSYHLHQLDPLFAVALQIGLFVFVISCMLKSKSTKRFRSSRVVNCGARSSG